MEKKTERNLILGVGAVGAALLGFGLYKVLAGNDEEYTPPVPTKFYCPYCDAWFYTPGELAAHIALFHSGQSDDYQEQVDRIVEECLDLLEKTLAIETLVNLAEKTQKVTEAFKEYQAVLVEYQQYPSDGAKNTLDNVMASLNRSLNELSDAWIEDINAAKGAAIRERDLAISTHALWVEMHQYIAYIYSFTGPVLILYGDRNYSGDHVSRFPVGRYPNLSSSETDKYKVPGFLPIRNNQASSLKLTKDFRVTLYSEDNYVAEPFEVCHELTLHGPLDIPLLDNIPSSLLNPDDYYTHWEDDIESMIIEPDIDDMVASEPDVKQSAQLAYTNAYTAAVHFYSIVRDGLLLALILAVASFNIPGLDTNKTLSSDILKTLEGIEGDLW